MDYSLIAFWKTHPVRQYSMTSSRFSRFVTEPPDCTDSYDRVNMYRQMSGVVSDLNLALCISSHGFADTQNTATSSGLAFFSERKVDLLVRRIGNSRLRDLIVGIDTALRSSLLTRTDTEISQSLLISGLRLVQVTPEEAAIYVKGTYNAQDTGQSQVD